MCGNGPRRSTALMLLVIVCNELARHLRSYRLAVLFVGGALLLVVSALAHVSEVREQRLDRTSLARAAEAATTLSQVVIPRPVAALGFLRGTSGEELREAAIVRPHLVDVPETAVVERSWLSGLATLDWATVAIFFYSLMAVAISHDAVAGEKADGTLRTLAGRPVGRTVLLAGKILAAFLVVAGSFVLAALAALVVLAVANAGAVATGSQVFVLLLAVAVILVFLLFNVLLGTAASASSSTPEAALQRAFGAWALLAFGVPGFVVVLASLVRPLESELDFQRNVALHEQSFRGRLMVSSVPLSKIVRTPGITSAEKRRRIADLESEMWADQEAALVEMEQGHAEIRREFLLQAAAQERWIDRWSALSPHALLRVSLDRVALTGSSGRQEFLRQVSRYEPVFTSFVLDQRERRRQDAREGSAMAVETDESGEEYTLQALTRLDYSAVEIDPGEVPQFSFRSPTAESLAVRALPDLLRMLFFACVVGGFAFLRFQRYDCR